MSARRMRSEHVSADLIDVGDEEYPHPLGPGAGGHREEEAVVDEMGLPPREPPPNPVHSLTARGRDRDEVA